LLFSLLFLVVFTSLEKIQVKVDTKRTLAVSLKEQPVIHVLYWTAWTNDEGIIQFRKDLYERGFAVNKALIAEK
jgi:murein L,D-transpeptidase YcbB/YkuD